MLTIVLRYEEFIPEKKASVRIASYLFVKMDLYHENTAHSSSPAVTSVHNPVLIAFIASETAMQADPQPPMAPNLAPVGHAAQGN